MLIGYEMYRLVSNGLKTKKFRGKKGKLLLEENRDIGKGKSILNSPLVIVTNYVSLVALLQITLLASIEGLQNTWWTIL